MKRKALLVADGEPLPKASLAKLRKGRFVVAVDGAAEQARKEGWVPQVIAGDFDTVKPATLAYFARRGARLLATPDQDHTDLEKALAWCIAKGATDLWVAQALGRRLDHTLANLGFLKKFHSPKRRLVYFTGSEEVRFVEDSRLSWRGPLGRRIAVIPFPSGRVTSHGLQFEMCDDELELGRRESVSNHARLNRVQLEVKGQCLLVEERKIE